jgi:serine/threonine protein kinase
MSVAAGTRLAHYDVSGLLGSGGMGEVYRATDTRLKRDVALKILPPSMAGDPSHLSRFEREARVLASLNHRNIAAIYGLEESGGIRFLVLELVQGPTLAERIDRGPIPVGEALRIATQIAEALEAAHEKGVIHRDLKPSNVKLVADGTVKVLDFGLAKALHGDLSDQHDSPTITSPSAPGIVMGTPAYMSPEQAQGRALDKRTDVWSFGAVLYEMLAGHRAFQGKTTSHILVQLQEADPDWSKLPSLPSGVPELLKRCLEKDASKRLRDIGDVRILLEAALAKPDQVPVTSRPSAGGKRLVTRGVAALIAAGLAGAVYMQYPRAKPVPTEAVRFDIVQPDGAKATSQLSVSPNGRTLAFIATGANGRTQLWVRSLDSLEARPLPGTEDANGLPFWSPDSRTIIFGTEPGYQMKKIEAAGGPPQTLFNLSNRLAGGFSASDGKLVFGTRDPNAWGLFQIDASGGTPMPLTKPASGGDFAPFLLPDGKHYLYQHGASPEVSANGIFWSSLDSKPGEQPVRILPDSSRAVYVPAANGDEGYLLFVRSASNSALGTLMAQRFDTKNLKLSGEPVAVADQVAGGQFTAAFTASSNGVLVYHTGPPFIPGNGGPGYSGKLTWFDHSGNVLSTVGNREDFALGLKLSPDGTRVASAHGPGNADIWVFDFARGVSARLTSDPLIDSSAVWSPDGTEIVFEAERSGGMYRRSANPGGAEQLLFKPPSTDGTAYPSSWSSDGRFLLFATIIRGIGDIWVLPMTGERKPVPIVKTQFSERGGLFSPDGRWFAYTSNDNGKDDAYVRPFDPVTLSSEGGQILISKDGGSSPHWRGDGKELFYTSPAGTMMSVDVDTASGFHAGVPKTLFRVPPGTVWFDVTRDGQRFLIPVPESLNASYTVVLNWMSGLKR